MSQSLHRTGVAGDPASPIHRLDPRAKLIGFAGITLVAVSTPLPALARVRRVRGRAGGDRRRSAACGPASSGARVRVILPLVLFVAAFVPFVRGGPRRCRSARWRSREAGLATFALVAAKATIGAVSAVLLGATTSFPDILHGLERLHAPRLLTVIAGFMYRYVFVIADEARRMRAALAARAYRPRHLGQIAALGRMVTALFLRSYERGERVYLAMLARGYAGAMPRLGVLAFRRADTVFLAALAVAPAPAAGGGMSCAIDARGLRYRYPNGVVGLDGVDLHVTHGERVAVLGPNGAGKTTLMLHLNGLLKRRGLARGGGLRAGQGDVRELRSAVGLVFQDPDDQLFMPTVARGRRVRPAQPRPAARRGARARSRRAGRRADGARRRTARRISCRSASGGGWRSRPCWPCARGLLVLDEPSANLDPRARRELLEVLDTDRADDARRDARPAVRGPALRARGAALRRPHRRRRALRGDPRRRAAARSRTTSSCRSASTSRVPSRLRLA